MVAIGQGPLQLPLTGLLGSGRNRSDPERLGPARTGTSKQMVGPGCAGDHPPTDLTRAAPGPPAAPPPTPCAATRTPSPDPGRPSPPPIPQRKREVRNPRKYLVFRPFPSPGGRARPSTSLRYAQGERGYPLRTNGVSEGQGEGSPPSVARWFRVSQSGAWRRSESWGSVAARFHACPAPRSSKCS